MLLCYVILCITDNKPLHLHSQFEFRIIVSVFYRYNVIRKQQACVARRYSSAQVCNCSVVIMMLFLLSSR